MKTPSAETIHQAASQGFQSGAAIYASGRPDYPSEIVGWLKGVLGLGPDKKALDLGAGTGKFLPSLLQTGATIVAVEPVEAMRSQLGAAFPNVERREGTATSIPAPDASVDAIVCAQAFHWFATKEAMAEIRRILKPRGSLGLIWNVRDENVGWVKGVTDLITPYEGDTPRYSSEKWREVFPAEGFAALEESRFPYEHVGAPEQVIVERTVSTSFIAALPEDERARLATRIRELIADTPDLRGRDKVAYPYVTCAYSCRKL